jgi:type I restriction enzyme S subunit
MEFRQIEFSQIAEDWSSGALGREIDPPLLLVRNGLPLEQRRDHGEFRITRIETISDGFINESKVGFVSGLSPEQVQKYRILKDDVLFSHINSDPHLGKTAIAETDYADLLHGMNLLLVRTNPDVLTAKFFHFLCTYYRQKGVFIKICSRSVNQSSINQAKLKALEIPLPPLTEQTKIAQVLGLVRRSIEQQERLLSLIAELKKSLLHQLFTHGLCNEPQKQTEVGPIPRSWKVMELQEAAVAFDYGTSVKCESNGAGFPVLRIPNVMSGSIDVTDLKYGQPKRTELESLRLSDGDLLFVRTNGVQENAGRCALFRSELADCYFASYLIRVRTKITKLLPGFLNEYARTERGKKFLAGRAIRTADGKYNINSGILRRVMIPLPSLAEQKEIVDQLELTEQKGQVHRRKHAALTAMFRSLLHELMTARLRIDKLKVPELEDARV